VAYAPLDNGEQKLTIFDIRTGAEKRSFISDAPMVGNVLRWSKDDKYFARIGHNTLSVYETPVSI
jgi:translation initiation factor 3 subunit B